MGVAMRDRKAREAYLRAKFTAISGLNSDESDWYMLGAIHAIGYTPTDKRYNSIYMANICSRSDHWRKWGADHETRRTFEAY
jgi:hypothetical protein